MRFHPFIVAIIMLTMAAVPARADKRVAPVIGNAAYRNMTPLQNPGNDAQVGNTYGVGHLFDGNRSTAWIEGVAGQGIGEWIIVEFDAARLVRSIAIDNGYQKNSDIFYKNSRVRQITAVFSGGERKSLSLQDQFGQQVFSLDRPIRARWIQFIIDDVYPGSKYQDTAISKLSVVAQ